MTTATRDFAIRRRLWRKPMATPIQPAANGDQLAERFLLALICALALILVVRLWP